MPLSDNCERAICSLLPPDRMCISRDSKFSRKNEKQKHMYNFKHDNANLSRVILVYCREWMGLPITRPFFSQVREGGGIPVASQAKVTGLLMVSVTRSTAGPSSLGGTV